MIKYVNQTLYLYVSVLIKKNHYKYQRFITKVKFPRPTLYYIKIIKSSDEIFSIIKIRNQIVVVKM